jgi:cysteinyl-tRNA synthetase
MLKLYNTLSRKKEGFKPLKNKKVGLYTCGPTVYWFAHIGNLRTYVFEDILKRALKYNNYQVKHVMNITDVGHLTSDADTGEDKMELGAKREKKTAWQIAEFYTKSFKRDINFLNIKEPDVWVKATETIDDQINIIKILEKKGFTYKIADGIYFDTSKIKNYGKLTGRKKKKLKAGARIKMVPGKKNPADFALWKFTPAGVKRQMEWDSPWGRGFPGWHTECVVMAAKYLGLPLDIHCGGIDHITIHHTNEIAQSEAAFGKNLARFWLHGEFLKINRGRMGKSEGNIVTLETLIEKGFNPLAYRYLCLNTHYMSKLNFSWPALEGAQNALNNLYERIRELDSSLKKITEKKSLANYQKNFLDLINDNLNTPKALALVWKIIKDKRLGKRDKKYLLSDFDKVLGLNLTKVRRPRIPQKIKELAKLREKYRQEKKWPKADEIRKKLEGLGYQIEDRKDGPEIKISY